MRVLAATGVLGVFAAWFLGAAYVPLLFGAAYAPVAANLLPLSVAALAFALASVPSILALVHERPLETVVAAALRLVVFWGIAPLLVAQHGSRGACLAVLAGASVHALYLGWRTRHLVWDRSRIGRFRRLSGHCFCPWRCSAPAVPRISRFGVPAHWFIAPPSWSFGRHPRGDLGPGCYAPPRRGPERRAGSDLMISRLPEASRGIALTVSTVTVISGPRNSSTPS